MTKLKSLRLASGMTQEELSAASGVKLSTLQKLETGANHLEGARAGIVLRLARSLKTTVEALLSEEA